MLLEGGRQLMRLLEKLFSFCCVHGDIVSYAYMYIISKEPTSSKSGWSGSSSGLKCLVLLHQLKVMITL